MERRQAAEIAKQHLLRTSGLERWRAATTARRHSRGLKRIATVHWATALSAKVWCRCRLIECDGGATGGLVDNREESSGKIISSASEALGFAAGKRGGGG